MLQLRPRLRLLPLLYLCFVFFPLPASNQTAGHRGGTAAGAGRRGAERIKVLFTPTICKVRCTQGRCTNFCEQGNVTALYISEQGDRAALGPGFRVCKFLTLSHFLPQFTISLCKRAVYCSLS